MTEPFERTLEDTAAVLGTDATGALLATRARVRVIEGPDAGTALLLERGTMIVGSGPGADLMLRDPRVSRAHLELALLPRGVRARDLGSRNGSFVAEVRLREATLPLGSTIRVGRTILELAADAIPVAIVPRSALGPLRAASPAMQHALGLAAQVAASRAAVLIEGEPGAGKTALAHAIDALAGGVEPGGLCALDLRALVDPGALSRALADALGARTLLLEHVDSASALAQRALAAALDRRDTERGARVLATARDDLRALVAHGAFDRALYFEVAAVRIAIPPLRERPEDVAAIVEALVAAGAGGWPSVDAIDAFRRGGAIGGARALRALVESTPRGEGPATPHGPPHATAPTIDRTFRDAKDHAVARFERDYLERLLTECGGNVSEASRRSGVARSHLVNLLKKHGLD